jgi:tol-pal system protein YbgF
MTHGGDPRAVVVRFLSQFRRSLGYGFAGRDRLCFVPVIVVRPPSSVTKMRMMLRLVLAVLAFAGGALVGPGAAFAQQNPSDLLVRIDRLENELRQLTGLVEQLQFRNQQLEATVKRLQADTEYRFQELGPRGGARAPARPSANAIQPAAPGPAPQAPRRSDAFDPTEHPNAPGAPRTLGSIYGNAAPPPPPPAPPAQPPSNAGPPGIAVEEPGRAVGAPLDLGNTAAGRPGPAAAPGAPNAGFALATAPPSSSPRDNFDLAYGYLQRRDYSLAEATFRDFLRKFPSDRLAAEAQYWLGESLFLRQSYRDAADAFLAMSKKYETSAKAPDALLRLGQSLAALDEKELACATFGEVARKYPRASASVKQAVEREQKRVRC